MDANGVVHIDPGFLMAKCIKHAFKSYPKVRIGRGTELQSQQVDEPAQLSDEEIYGVDPDTGEVLDNAPEPAPQPFGNNEPPQGVTVNTDDEEGFLKATSSLAVGVRLCVTLSTDTIALGLVSSPNTLKQNRVTHKYINHGR